MTITFIIKDYVNNKTYPEIGALVFNEVKKDLNTLEFVIIDMDEISSVPTSFMNTSFGDLIEEYGIQKTKSFFRFKNIRKTQLERFAKYFKDYEELLKNKTEQSEVKE